MKRYVTKISVRKPKLWRQEHVNYGKIPVEKYRYLGIMLVADLESELDYNNFYI